MHFSFTSEAQSCSIYIFRGLFSYYEDQPHLPDTDDNA